MEDNKNIVKAEEEEEKSCHEETIESLGLEPFEEMVLFGAAIE